MLFADLVKNDTDCPAKQAANDPADNKNYKCTHDAGNVRYNGTYSIDLTNYRIREPYIFPLFHR